MNSKMDFLDILASTLHDTKNSLGVLFNTLEEVIEECKLQDCARHQRFYVLQYEIKRLNSSLIRLLSLYKADRSQFVVNVDFYSVCEFLEDVSLQHQPLLASKGIDIEVDCSEDLFWAFDRGLISGVLDNVLNNAFNYAKDKVRISASQDDGLILRVEDNGRGYPDHMVLDGEHGGTEMQPVNFDSGSTGLGLYFSLLVAEAHVHDNRSGRISVTNGGALGGGVFSIYLP